MIRLFAITANLFAAIILRILFQGDVGLTVDTPAEVVAGNEFEVRITIEKGELESFSRLLHNLPAGLTASSSTTSNADFSFDKKRARFIWLRLPEEEQFTISYKVKVDQRLKGSFTIGGKFSYIDQNERRSVNAESNTITILPSPDIDPGLIVDISEFEKLVIPYISPAEADPQIACIRQTPIITPQKDGYIVNILVSKERKEKFAKIEETIPAGFKAEQIEERDAIFTYKNNMAKYLWMNLPASSFFMVSYKLTPIDGRMRKLPNMKGKFSYLEEDKTISIDIKQTSEELAQINSPEELNNLIMTLSSPALASNGVRSDVTPPLSVKTDETPEDITTTIDVGINNPQTEKRPKTKPGKKELRSNIPYLLEPEDGIYYRVQLAAGHSPVHIKRYFKRYQLEKEVRKEYHNGWHKYSIGSFQEYKRARDYRVHIWNTTVIDDAFVAAYNDGSRITVQEALMIANQKWYK